VGQEVLHQVRPPGGLAPGPAVLVHLDPVGRVAEPDPAVRTLDVHLRFPLDRGGQGEGAGHVEARGGADPDHRGVVAVDGAGPVEIGLHRLHVLERPAVDDGQSGDHGMGQGVGGHTVHHRLAAQAAPAGPRGAGPVPGGPRPGADGADPHHRPDAEGVAPQHLDGVRAQTLEADLDHVAGLPLEVEQPTEVVQ
jgi:hypothetical protein